MLRLSQRARGFTLIELAVVAVIFALLAGTLLSRALFYEEQAERVSVEQTLSILRGAMHLQMADRLLHARWRPMAQLAGDNPMNWLAELPPNYVGEYFDPKPGTIDNGNWYFDTKDHTLVYLATYPDHLQIASKEKGSLRFRTRLSMANSVNYAATETLPARSVPNTAFEGVVLEAVTPYKWL